MKSPLSCRTLINALGAALLCAGHAVSAETFTSPGHRVRLIELYTSEGCSSCPPADRWISALQPRPGLWHEFIPVAFHVDYWDYIGWRDRFASADFSGRQRAYARSGGLATVYTPGFVVNGEEWRGWFRGETFPATSEPAGVLRIEAGPTDFSIRFIPTTDAGAYAATIVMLGMGLTSDVRAGENRGRQLRHDFVVLETIDIPLERAGDAYVGRAAREGGRLDTPPSALAGWVSRRGQLAPLQATGGWLDDR